MKKLIVPFTVFIVLQMTAEAQDSSTTKLTDGNQQTTARQRQNSLFIELGGSSPAASLNYERFLSRKPGGFSIRAGIGLGAAIPYGEFFSVIPLGISYHLPISKNKNEFLEMGGTYTILGGNSWTDKPTTTGNPNLLTPQFSYRYQWLKSNFHIRLTLSPHIIAPGNDVMNGKWLFGFSLGKKF